MADEELQALSDGQVAFMNEVSTLFIKHVAQAKMTPLEACMAVICVAIDCNRTLMGDKNPELKDLLRAAVDEQLTIPLPENLQTIHDANQEAQRRARN